MSMMIHYFKEYISFPEGSVDDEEIRGILLELASAKHSTKVWLGKDGKMYCVSPGDTLEMIKNWKDRRNHLDRRLDHDRRKGPC